MDNTLDTIRPSDTGTLQADMSYLFGRDPSILAYGQRPLPTSESKRNLYSLYEEEPSDSRIDSSSATSISLSSQTVKVYLRMKPLSRKLKLSKQEAEAYQIINSTTLLTKLPSLDNNTSSLKRSKGSATVCRRFTFTHTFGPDTSQLQLFEQAVKQQMVEFLGGQNSTVMSYGTTNAGKSYTLQGTTASPGIIPRGLEFVFSNIDPRPTPCYKPVYHCNVMSLDANERAYEMETKTKLLTFGSVDKYQYINAYKQMQKLLQEESPMRPSHSIDASYSVWVSFAEIYNETIYDLLSNDCQKKRPPLKLATDNHGRPFIKGLKTICVNSGSEAYQVLMLGQYNLKVAATALNARSSRSHCIFTIKLLKYYKENSPEAVEVSTFSFCDLAGSERLKKTLNVGERLKEAQNINTSLLVLGRCLKSIWEGQTVKQKQDLVGPFRESKLTRLFQRALSGREHIALIVNVNPLPNLYVETQNVLNFSAIAKKIVIELEENKKRRSLSRFSQMVTQSIKTVTDWDTVNIVEESEPTSPEKSEFIDPEDYADLQTENANLKKEIAALKSSALNRDLQIRQEMANTYTIMMKDLEATWKSRIRDAEEQQEDMLTWSVKQVEDFYEDKLSQMSRKRRRSNEDDESDNEETIQELKKENTHLSARIVSLKDTVRGLKGMSKNLQLEKNKTEFEMALVKEELKNMKKLLKEVQNDVNYDGKTTSYIEELEKQLEAKDAQNKNLKKFLDEAKQEYIEITSHGEKMESQLEEQQAILMENAERISDLEEQLEYANACLTERTCEVEVLEEKLEVQGKELIVFENKANSAANQLSKFETKNLLLLEEVERLQKIVIQTEEKSLSNTQNHSDINPEHRKYDNEKKIIDDLQEKLLQATDKIEELQKSLAAREAIISDLETKLSEAKVQHVDVEKLEKIQEKRHQVTEKADELQKSFASKEAIISDLETKLSEDVVQNSDLEKLEKLREKLSKATDKTDQLQNSNASKEVIIADLKAQLSDAEAKNLELAELAELREKLHKATNEIEELQNRLSSKEVVIADLESKISDAELSNFELKEKLLQSNNETKLLREDLQLSKVKLNEIMNQISDLKVAVSIKDEMCDAANQTSCPVNNVASVEKEIGTSLRMSNSGSEKFSRITATLDSANQTSEIAKTEQIIQTSFVEIKTEEKKCQTSFIIDDRKTDELLEELKLEHSKLKKQHLYENLQVKELTQKLENAQRSMEKLKEISDDNELRVKEYVNSVESIEKELSTVTIEKEGLEKELIAANVVRQDLKTKLSSCEVEIKELNERLTQSLDKEQHTSESLDGYIEKITALESKLSKTITQLDNTTTKCQTEHEPKLESLEKERREAIERDVIKTQSLDAYRERISKLDQELAAVNELQQKVKELDEALEKCQKEKDDLQRELDENIESMSSLTNKLQAAIDKEQEKDNEIVSLQREIKTMIHQNNDGSQSEKEMERVIKQTLKDLNATKEALTNKEQEFDQLQKSSKREIDSLEMRLKTYEQNAAYVAFLQEGAESRQAENERLREMNNELKRKLLDKDHEMEAFSRNRDETITKYEGLFKTMQEDGERNKREVARFQEVFMRQATPTHSKEEIRKLKDALRSKENLLEKAQNELKKLKSSRTNKENLANTSDDEAVISDPRPTRRRGRREAANTISEPNSEDIAVIELSGSESKRRTRQTALPPPEAPSTEKKRTTRKKKLFVQTDEGCVDVEPCESAPRPSPSPLSVTHNLRNRRK